MLEELDGVKFPWRSTVIISRSTFQVCGMMSNKVDATHQAMNRYNQLARTRESRRYALGYEPIGPDDPYERKPTLHIKLDTRKEGR
jgi:hypothetical protein